MASEDPLRCPKCSSTQLSANQKGLGLVKAIGGSALLGIVGLLAVYLVFGPHYVTGTLQVFIQHGGLDDDGILLSQHYYLMSGTTAYDLVFLDTCAFVNMGSSDGNSTGSASVSAKALRTGGRYQVEGKKEPKYLDLGRGLKGSVEYQGCRVTTMYVKYIKYLGGGGSS